jgi:DNA-binding MarR family transcriptional regulator
MPMTMIDSTEDQLPQPAPASARHEGDIDLPVVAWMRLMRVYHKIDRRTAQALRCWNLSVSRFDVLNQAGIREGRTQQELADALLVTKGNIVQLLDGMESDGLLVRRRSGRTNHIYLTDRGRALRQDVLAAHEANIARHLSVLSPDEQQTLLGLLRTIDRSLS